MSGFDGGVAVAIAAFFVVWTGTIIGFMRWLTARFNEMNESLVSRVPMEVYEKKHDDLEIRIRKLEMQNAARMGAAK